MKGSQEQPPRKAEPEHDGTFSIPISTNNLDVELRVTGSRLRDDDREDAAWEEYDKSRHEPRLLTFRPSEESGFVENFNDNDTEDITDMYEFDVTSVEDLNTIKAYLQDLRLTIKQWAEAGGLNDISDKQKAMLQRIGLQISDVNDLIRFQNEALTTDVPVSEIQSRGEKISLALGNLLETYDQFSEWVTSGEEPESEKEQKKTGWWDKDFQKKQGVLDVTDVVPTQKWGDQDGPIGFEPPQTETGEGKERTGWWKDEYREEQGIETSLTEKTHTQRGDFSVPGDLDSLKTDRFVSEPVSGGRTGQVRWSVQGAEGLSSAPVTADSLTNEPEATPLEEEAVGAPVNPAYEQAREAWREAKKAHDLSQEKSRQQTEEYYEKWWNKARSTVGFKPDLPSEINALIKEAASATALYHKASLELLAAQSLDASPETMKKLERHGRMIAYSLALRNSNDLIEAQKQGLMMKDSAAFDFIKKHGKKLRIAGAATVGAATGGLFVGAWAAGRVLAGAAVTGAATGFVGKKLDARVEAKKTEYSEKYKEEVESIIATIQSKQEKKEALSADELLDIQSKLSSLYAVVDKATKDRIRGVLATGFATSVLFGLGASELADAVAGVPELSANTDVPEEVPSAADASAHSAGVGESAAPGAVPATLPESVPPGASEAAPSVPYIAEKGDNFWDIMEGQTDAGKPAYLDHVDASHKQEIIDLVRDRIEDDPAMLKELGFGENADQLQIGAEVDTERLNELAEEIAKEKGRHIEAAPDAADTPPAPETPPVDTDQPKVLDAEAAPEAAVVTNVSPDKINDFARSYPKGLYPTGFQNFNHDFQTLWVDRVQGPPPASGGFLDMFFNKAPLSDSAYNEFDSFEIGDFKKLATVDASVLASRLADKNIDMADYLAWKDEIAKWEKEGLVIDPKDRFSDVAEAAFINSLEKTKAV